MQAKAGSGIHALVDLAGAPVPVREASALGLAAADRAIEIRGFDAGRADAVSLLDDGTRITLLVGRLADVTALAARLGLSPETPAAVLARAALDRFGDETPNAMDGNWSLLDWRAGDALTLVTSVFARDPIFYARYGSRIAVAPRLETLRTLGWTNQALDPAGLLFALGRGALRRMNDATTILPGARRVPPGATVCLTDDGVTVRTASARPAPPPWRGSFTEAMEEIERLLRQIVREEIGTAPIACMLSGGLDSTILAWLAAEERQADQPLHLLCSAAHPDLPTGDEMAFAELVSDRLGLPIEPVAPSLERSTYRPTAERFAVANGPVLAPFHYLFEMFCEQAGAVGAPILLDGGHGESTVSRWNPDRGLRERVARMLGRRMKPQSIRERAFHIMLAPHRSADLPEAIIDAIARADAVDAAIRDKSLVNAGFETTELPGDRVRLSLPFRDRRLYDLFARFPDGFAEHAGLDRAPARHLLAGRMPDAIRLRRKGGAFAPDYALRLQKQAPEALARLPVFRRAGVDEWLDLEWLENALQRTAAAPPNSIVDAFDVQLTTMVAEYLSWWNDAS